MAADSIDDFPLDPSFDHAICDSAGGIEVETANRLVSVNVTEQQWGFVIVTIAEEDLWDV